MQLTFKSGTHTLADHIPHKDANLIKIRLIREGNAEGIWAMVTDEDRMRYNDDNGSGSAIAVLCNQSLAGVPWGAYLPIRLCGDQRPVCHVQDHFEDGTKISYADWASASICESILKGLQDGSYKLEDQGLKEGMILHVLNAPESDVTAALKSLLES